MVTVRTRDSKGNLIEIEITREYIVEYLRSTSLEDNYKNLIIKNIISIISTTLFYSSFEEKIELIYSQLKSYN